MNKRYAVVFVSAVSSLAIIGGALVYALYYKNAPVKPSMPGNSFVDAFGNTIPAISQESFAKLKPGCPRYLMLGNDPVVTNADKPDSGAACVLSFTVSNAPPDLLAVYRAYFKKAEWVESSTKASADTYVFERAHQRIELNLSPASGGTAVILSNFYY